MKTEGMEHQLKALDWLDGRRYGALFMEQGTGKTWDFLADAERYYLREKCCGLFVIAPNGVHTNWVLREAPQHLGVPYVAFAWTAGMNKTKRRAMEKVMLQPPKFGDPFRLFTINYDALRSKEAREFCIRALQIAKPGYIMVLDESQKIKNPDAAVTGHVMGLRPFAVARRIGSGTPMDKPFDIWAQLEFLREGLSGTDSYRVFCSSYAQMANWREPKTDSDWAMKRQVEKNPRMSNVMMVAKDDTTGMPIYRNLDQLHSIVAAESFRVLKKDCLGLPDKVYQSVYFELTPKQRAAYDLMEDQQRIVLEDGELTPVAKLAALTKLQQITSGFIVVPGREELMYIEDGNPRIELIAETLRDVQGKSIVWAKFREEIAAIGRTLRKMNLNVAEYHGGVSKGDREKAIDGLQEGDVDVFLGVQKAGGTGLTLTAAEFTMYASNEHSAILRNQSEDRNHRKGTKGEVTYVDVVGIDTIDESITKAHQFKTDVVAQILGDRQLSFAGIASGII
jgi:SNF2 family DNA or RNA helicase